MAIPVAYALQAWPTMNSNILLLVTAIAYASILTILHERNKSHRFQDMILVAGTASAVTYSLVNGIDVTDVILSIFPGAAGLSLLISHCIHANVPLPATATAHCNRNCTLQPQLHITSAHCECNSTPHTQQHITSAYCECNSTLHTQQHATATAAHYISTGVPDHVELVEESAE